VIRPREVSLRGRLLLVSVLALAVGLIAGGVVLVGVLNYVLLRGINAQALETGHAVAGLIDQHSLSEPIPVNAGMQVQVIDPQARVLAISAGADPLVAMLRADELRGLPPDAVVQVPGDRVRLSGMARVTVVDAGTPTEPVYVLVARSTGDLSQGVHQLRVVLLITFPVLVGLLAAVLWRVLGAALRPVEALRAGAE
jgi:hypothetical protein